MHLVQSALLPRSTNSPWVLCLMQFMALVNTVLEAYTCPTRAIDYSVYFYFSLKVHMSELTCMNQSLCPSLLSKFNTGRDTGYFLGMQIMSFLHYITRLCINFQLSFVKRKIRFLILQNPPLPT